MNKIAVVLNKKREQSDARRKGEDGKLVKCPMPFECVDMLGRNLSQISN